MTIVLVDTSIFLNVLDVPGRNQDRVLVMGDFEERLKRGDELLLPIAAILETGNHIGQVSDGRLRRQAAGRFVTQVRMALSGEAPWVPARPIGIEEIAAWLDDFPDHAMRGLGIGDVSIIAECERQRVINRGRRVEIWSLDHHLRGV